MLVPISSWREQNKQWELEHRKSQVRDPERDENSVVAVELTAC